MTAFSEFGPRCEGAHKRACGYDFAVNAVLYSNLLPPNVYWNR